MEKTELAQNTPIAPVVNLSKLTTGDDREAFARLARRLGDVATYAQKIAAQGTTDELREAVERANTHALHMALAAGRVIGSIAMHKAYVNALDTSSDTPSDYTARGAA